MSSETCSYSLCLSHCSSCMSMHYINTYKASLHLYVSIYTSPRNAMITAEYNLSIRGTLNKGHLSNEDSVFVCIIMDPQNNTSECLYAAVCEEHCCSHSHGRWRKWCHKFAADWCTWLNFTVRDTTYMHDSPAVQSLNVERTGWSYRSGFHMHQGMVYRKKGPVIVLLSQLQIIPCICAWEYKLFNV